MRHVPCFALLLAVGCTTPRSSGDSPQVDAAAARPVMSLTVSPADTTIATTEGAPGTADFAVTAHYVDGADEDVTAQAGWQLANPALGAVAGGHVTAGTARGGSTTVQANYGGASATANLTVKLAVVRVAKDDGSTAPDDAAAKFAGGAEDKAVAPLVVYPLDGTFLPSNLGSLEIQWRLPASPADLYEVALTGKTIDLRAYTNAAQPGGGRFFLRDSDWDALAQSVDGGLVTLTVRARSKSDPGKLGTSQPVTFTVGRDEVRGGIYYWSATGGPATEGVQRHAFGDTKSLAKPFYTQSEGFLSAGGENHCVACHVLSRDGTRMAVTYDGGDGVSGIIDVATKKPLVSAAQGLHWNFASFNPDGSRLVTSSMGVLTVRDPTTGKAIETLKPLAGARSTQPDWSPDGKSIVFVATGAYGSDWSFKTGSIVVSTDSGAGFATTLPKVLVGSKGENNYYPSYSPDGRWILFNRSNGDAYSNADATVWIVASDGSVGPLHLDGADIQGNTDSWCRWSPFVQHNGPDGDLLYFTYSSKRDYGIEIVGQQRPQIWMAAFNPKSGEVGAAPSAFTPFWMPFQDPATSNHIAQWTQTLVGIQ